MSYVGEMFSKPVHGKMQRDEDLPIPDAKIGIEVEVEKWDRTYPIKYWEAKNDGSLRNNGVEFVTLGGMIGSDISAALDVLLAVAKKGEWSEGYPRAGIHIHLDVTDLSVENGELAALVAHYMLLEHALIAFAGEWRRECGFCVPFDVAQEDFEMLGELLHSENISSQRAKSIVRNYLSKYQALNLRPLGTQGTIEFRALPTTFDKQRIMTWISFILAIKAKAKEGMHQTSPLTMLSKLQHEGYVRAVLGKHADALMPFIDPAQMWNAVDNATALMAHGKKFKLNGKWDASTKPSPLISLKVEALRKKNESKIKKESQ